MVTYEGLRVGVLCEVDPGDDSVDERKQIIKTLSLDILLEGLGFIKFSQEGFERGWIYQLGVGFALGSVSTHTAIQEVQNPLAFYKICGFLFTSEDFVNDSL